MECKYGFPSGDDLVRFVEEKLDRSDIDETQKIRVLISKYIGHPASEVAFEGVYDDFMKFIPSLKTIWYDRPQYPNHNYKLKFIKNSAKYQSLSEFTQANPVPSFDELMKWFETNRAHGSDCQLIDVLFAITKRRAYSDELAKIMYSFFIGSVASTLSKSTYLPITDGEQKPTVTLRRLLEDELKGELLRQ